MHEVVNDNEDAEGTQGFFEMSLEIEHSLQQTHKFFLFFIC